MTTVAEVLDTTSLARRDAEILLQCALGRDRAWLFAHSSDQLTAEQMQLAEHLFDRCRAGEPVAYIVGSREFWSLSLQVSPAVLIPRPDTEVLVQWALQCIAQHHFQSVLDLGTGSGAIALALKSERPELAVTAVDCSTVALAQARRNGDSLGLAVEWQKSDWFAALDGRCWPLIVANPPYIAEGDPHLAQGDLPAEPREALVSGHDGLDAIREIIRSGPAALEPGGWLLLEHGFDQGDAVRQQLREAGFIGIATRVDLAGHERVTGGRWHE